MFEVVDTSILAIESQTVVDEEYVAQVVITDSARKVDN